MPWLSNNVYSKLPEKDLEERINFNGFRLILSDIDGTLHKGLLWGKYGGITYVDMSIYLGLELMFNPLQLLKFKYSMAKIFISEMMERNEEKLICDFANSLVGLDYFDVHVAAQKVSCNVSMDAINVLKKVCNEKTEFYLLGKSLGPIAKSYKSTLQTHLNTYVCAIYNPLKIKDGKVVGFEKKILNVNDKARYAADILKRCNPEQVLAFGDSKEDERFFRQPYPPKSLRIAVNPKDEIIKDASDIWSWNWKELYSVLFKK